MIKKAITKIILSIILINASVHAEPTQQEHTNFADILFLLASHTVLHFGLAVAHELGHMAIAKLFISLEAPLAKDTLEDSFLYAPNTSKIILKSNNTLEVSLQYPEFKCGLLNAMVTIAGPIAGALASYSALKATNIIIELNRNNTTLEAIKKGLKKDAFNEEQPSSVKGLVFAHLLFNGFTLIPYKSHDNQIWSEGEKIRYFVAQKWQ